MHKQIYTQEYMDYKKSVTERLKTEKLSNLIFEENNFNSHNLWLLDRAMEGVSFQKVGLYTGNLWGVEGGCLFVFELLNIYHEGIFDLTRLRQYMKLMNHNDNYDHSKYYLLAEKTSADIEDWAFCADFHKTTVCGRVAFKKKHRKEHIGVTGVSKKT